MSTTWIRSRLRGAAGRIVETPSLSSITCNFDSLSYVELFAGDSGSTGSGYRVGIYDGGAELTYATGVQHQPASRIHFGNWNRHIAFTKGKQYEIRFTRSGGDSVQFYYDQTDPYRYGGMLNNIVPNPADICMQVSGRMNPVDSTWLGVTNHYFDPPQGSGDSAALGVAKGMGIQWVREDFLGWGELATDTNAVIAAYQDDSSRGFSILGLLCYCNPAVSSYKRGDTAVGDTSKYPPCNLDTGENYWAEYCTNIMQRLSSVHYWEVWPEANTRSCWRDPDTLYYKGTTEGFRHGSWIDTPRERCSLYVRMCFIAESVAKTLASGRKILAGCPCRLIEPYVDSLTGDTLVASGISWLGHMFDLAKRRFGGVAKCFDIVSVHPYMWYWPPLTYFREDVFRVNLDTARWVMRRAGYPAMELWATEYGWPRWDENNGDDPASITDTLTEADNVGKFMVSAMASQADPRGFYDRALHYELTSSRTSHYSRCRTGGYGFLDSTGAQPRMPHSWAFSQISATLVGKRCNGRAMPGYAEIDTPAMIYEFEDNSGRRTWVCWRNGDVKQGVNVKLPVWTDSIVAEPLAYASTTPTLSPRVANDGWLSLTLNPRPVFIREASGPQRPDLRVDSVACVQTNRVLVRAWVTNHGNRSTPVRSRSRPYPTWAVLKAEGDSLAQVVRTASIAVDQQVEFTFSVDQTKLPDTTLLSVTVDPNQTFVELGTDDNTGYVLAVKH